MQVNFLEPHSPYQGTNKKKMMLIIFFCFFAASIFAGTAWAGNKFFAARAEKIAAEQDAATSSTQSASIEQIQTNTLWGKVKSLFASTNRALVGADDDRINIALYGIGGEGHDGAQLTDTIVIASIKPSTKQIALLSIPRDAMVNIPKYGWRKINEINAWAEQESPGSGGEVATNFIADFLDLDIPYFVRVDFSGFEKVIDHVDGVDVYVEKSFTDLQFPDNNYKYRPVSFAKGWEHMSGARALDFARSRHGNNFEGSDFARAKRQQKIMLAVRDKLLSGNTLLHPGRLMGILNTLDTHVLTNLKTNDLMQFATIARELNTSNITSVVLSDDPASVFYNDNSTGSFFLRPKDPSLKAIREIAANMFDEAATKKVDGIMALTPITAPLILTGSAIEIQNGTWRPGFAAREQKYLVAAGFKVSALGNAAVRPVVRTQIIDLTHKNPVVISELKKRYDADMFDALPETATSTPPTNHPGIDIIVILGENARDIAP